jgi:tetratricopeptide (TPR) repeat protein
MTRNLKALANAYFDKGLDAGVARDWPQALEWFRKALRFDTSRAEIWTNLGKALYWLKDYEEAHQAFERALQIQPGRADALTGLAATGGKAR